MPDSAQSSHPGTSQLAAFAQGKLGGAERTALQGHLTACPACRQALAALPGGGESASGRDTLATMGAPRPGAATQHLGSDVPADLANHPRYEVLQMLGQGGMGAVYKARHKKMDRLVALKIINAQLLNHPKAVERFHREVKAAAKLEHANIVRAYDADEAGGTHFLVMEFVEGTDLAKYVEKKGALPVAHACHFIRQAALGLQHAHEHGIVHRDIKPHNLMVTRDGVVKVTDFGLARLAREGSSEGCLTGELLLGTADYIAPEQAEDPHTADIRADIYSLGCSMYHLLTGRPPFGGRNAVQKIAGHLRGTVQLELLPATVPESLGAVLAKLLEKDPVKRYQMPGELAHALLPFVKKYAAKPGAARKPEETQAPPPELTQSPTPDQKQSGPLAAKYTNNLGMEFVLVPKGKYLMGGGGGTVGDQEINFPHDFYLGIYEVTQEEWDAVMGVNPSWFSRKGSGKDAVKDTADSELNRFPVERVSWNDAQHFIKELNQRDKSNGWLYRLPRESEWEYACRGGPFATEADYSFDFYFEKPTNTPSPDQGNFGQRLNRTCTVGSYLPNRLGLYDMHGNVWEWCDDADGTSARITRGGCWEFTSTDCRAAYRIARAPSRRINHLGLRAGQTHLNACPLLAVQ